jgi:hypothetical protein
MGFGRHKENEITTRGERNSKQQMGDKRRNQEALGVNQLDGPANFEIQV